MAKAAQKVPLPDGAQIRQLAEAMKSAHFALRESKKFLEFMREREADNMQMLALLDGQMRTIGMALEFWEREE